MTYPFYVLQLQAYIATEKDSGWCILETVNAKPAFNPIKT